MPNENGGELGRKKGKEKRQQEKKTLTVVGSALLTMCGGRREKL